MDEEKTTYPTVVVAEKLRKLREYLPGESKFLYRFAAHVADRLTPSHAPPHNIYGYVFPGVALEAFLDIRFRESNEDIQTVYGYTIPKNLLGHPLDSCFYLFDMIPRIFSAVTEGELRTKILAEFERLKSQAKERLDPLNQERTEYRAARSGKTFRKDELEFTDFPSRPIEEIARMETMPLLLFHYDTWEIRGRDATHYIPLPKHPGFCPMVAWAKVKK